VVKISDSNFKQQKNSRGAECARVLHEPCPPERQRAQGRPGARCTRGLACKFAIKKRTRAYRFSGNTPAFPAQWFYGLLRALPGDRAFLPPSSLRSLLLKNLTPASGCQDHTTSPSATCAVRLPCAVVSTASRPALVTWPTPLCVGRDGAKCAADLRVRSIPTGCDISTRRANQQLACDGAVKQNVFRNGARQICCVGQISRRHMPETDLRPCILYKKSSSPAKAGDPVRRGVSILSLASLEYWIARS
jgi:hypothetical protein